MLAGSDNVCTYSTILTFLAYVLPDGYVDNKKVFFDRERDHKRKITNYPSEKGFDQTSNRSKYITKSHGDIFDTLSPVIITLGFGFGIWICKQKNYIFFLF